LPGRFGLNFFPSNAVRRPALTLFRGDTTEFFSPHGASKGVMFLIALGKIRKADGLTVYTFTVK
jgi:hypothetical protein